MTHLPDPAARLTLPAIALALLGASACSGSDGASSNVTVTDSAGVSIVTNTGSGTWTDETRWSVEEVFRVGGFEGAEDARFGQVISVDVDADDRVYVADQQAKEVRVFGPEGDLVGVIGSPGEGPGELGAAFMGMFERDGEVWTIDVTGPGIQRFDLDEGYLGAVPFNLMDGVPIRLDETRTGVVAQRRDMGMSEMPTGSGDAVATIGTETPDTLMVLPVGESLQMGGGGLPQYSFFAPEPLWDVAPDGSTARGRNNEYRIEIRDPSGELRRIVTRDVERQEVTDGVRRAVLDVVREQAEAAGAPPGMVEPLLEQASFAEYVPAVIQFMLESDGTLWVQRTGDILESSDEADFDLQDLGSPNWDIFDPEGVFLGRLTLPGRFQPLRLIDGVLWGVDRDDLDVQSVVGMRVVR